MVNSKIKAIKQQSISTALVFLAVLLLLNVVSRFYFFRIDLTSDKRYSLGKETKEMLKNLDDVVYIKVYLDGDLPSGIRQLKESTKELLDDMRAYANGNIEYEFIDPLEGSNQKEQEEIIKQLYDKGLEPINLEVKEDEQQLQKIIFPGAIISYGNKYVPVMLLKQQIGVHPEQQLHNSIVGLEYEMISSIKKLRQKRKKRIAFITGHGELDEAVTVDIYNTLKQQYDVERIDLPKYKVGILRKFDLAIVAKPRFEFSELDKYKIDQFVVHGGKVIWMVESLLAEIDSLAQTGVAATMDYPLNLKDMFFKYGVYINTSLVEDVQCHLIPVMSTVGTQQRDFRPWPYYPIVFPTINHPIVNNLNAVWFRFASSIDTVGDEPYKKTILLQTSPQSKLAYHIAQISLQQVFEPLKPAMFNKGPQNLAVLVEGTFNSTFKGRIPYELRNSKEYGKYQEKGIPNKMIFISDGDIIANQVSRIREESYPLGYDRFTNQTFGNKNLVLNSIDYLLDDSGIINLRSKDFKLRLLDKAKVKTSKTKWQIINMVFPVLFFILFGLGFAYFRRKKYIG